MVYNRCIPIAALFIQQSHLQNTMPCLHRLNCCFCLLFATCIVWNSAEIRQSESNANHGSSFVFYQWPEYPRDCKEIQSKCYAFSSSGVYLIKPVGFSEPFQVFCNNDVDTGGWTVVQRRTDGSVFFNRNWEEYREGFGFLSSVFWLGNEKLSYITSQAVYELHIDMVLSNGSSFYIGYNAFRVTDEWNRYSLTSVGKFSGNVSSVLGVSISHADVFTDCYHAYQAGFREDGVYTIFPSGWTGEPFNVPCNMSIDGGGWTVIQRRVDGSVNFERNWDEFKNGFGVPGHEIWLGNDKIHYITNQRNYELRMDMVNLQGAAFFAKYNIFRISDELSKYQLTDLGEYNATSSAGFDAMAYQRNQSFSTPDNDNDPLAFNCAAGDRSGWWYGKDGDNNVCRYCTFNLNNIGTCSPPHPYWWNLPGTHCLMYTDMKIRPV